MPASSVSHVLFRWLPFRYNLRMGQDAAGLLLRNRQFIEGSLNELEDDKVTLSSVLFGLKSFDADSEVLALILRRPGAGTCGWCMMRLSRSPRLDPPASSGNSARGRQHTWELLTPSHAGQVASRVYERMATCTSLSGFVTTRMSLMRRPVMTTDITHPAAPWGSR